ncbi:MAG TPA: hypothetical protein VF269_08465 [Rhodanobacteraceae bacterium]
MNRSIKTFYWLTRREFWEHRGGFLWAPVITAGVVILIQILGLVTAMIFGDHVHVRFHGIAHADQLQQFGNFMDGSAMVLTGMVGLVLFCVLYAYCMKNLSEDRRDRSILFWKSLPLSDTNTVISKAFSAVIVATVIAFVISAIGAFIMLLIWAVAGSLHGGHFFAIMGAAEPGRLLLNVLGAAPVYWVWMLPAVGWLMLCSAFSAGKTARWAIALPLVIGALFSWVGWTQSWGHAVAWSWEHVFGRALLGLLPGSSAFLGDGNPLRLAFANRGQGGGINQLAESLMAQKYAMLFTPDFMWGALAGLLMIAAAIWLRRWRTEL